MMRLFRLLRILTVVTRYGLDEIALSNLRHPLLQRLVRFMAAGRRLTAPRGERLRLALQDLGPIFVKFGQVLSTRRDLIPEDIADELARLQDRVPPFDSDVAASEIERGLGAKITDIFLQFDRDPVASASIAQVHFGTLRAQPTWNPRIAATWTGRPVAVKVLRPGMRKVIVKDLDLLEVAAMLIEKVFTDGKRLRPREVVAEFRKYLTDELDLTREAANASQLRRNFADSPMLRVPEMYWDGCCENVIVMERMSGIPVSQIDRLRAANIDLKKLSANGVEIFFTQVFRDGFFHADMHPGNIYVGTEGADHGCWIALDFGIIGTLTDVDRNYLAQNFLAFFRRDYGRVAQNHIDSGWVPPHTRVDELENAIRAVCEPIIDRPLAEISFSQVLVRLFAASRRFNVEIQPQLVMLQKTLLNIEGLGRQLDPELDLWATAMPFLERWMDSQIGLRGLEQHMRLEAAQWAALLPQLPRLLHQRLAAPDATPRLVAELRRLRAETQRRNRLLLVGVTFVAAMALMLVWVFVGLPLPGR